MRVFSCFTIDADYSVPTLSFVFAASEAQARRLAREELREARRPLRVEICEGGALVGVEYAGGLRVVEGA